VVLNPGVVPARGYFDLADIVVTFEGPVDGYAGAVRRMPAAGYFYATSGTLPDPWSAVPPYLADLERRAGGGI
jgi:hypothetical protein